jgi:hypothetical protein
MIGINTSSDLEEALLRRRGNIVGVLFCPYQTEGQSLNATWPRNFEDWHVYSSSDLDILAAGYSVHGVSPAPGLIEVRKLDNSNMTLWFSREGMYECVEFVREKTENKWHPSGEFDLLFLEVGQQLGIGWHQLAAIDVGMLIREKIYPDAQRFMHELIAKFKGNRPSDVQRVYRDLTTLPTIRKYAGEAARAAPKVIIDAALKLITTLHGAAAE